MFKLHKHTPILLCVAFCAACSPQTAENTSSEGAFVVEYQPAQTPETHHAQQQLQQHNVLETFADTMNSFITIPRNITVAAKECEEPNAFFLPEEHTIEYCYNLYVSETQLFTQTDATEEEAETLAAESALGILFHEAGHALISELQLPITGREEDVADQLAAYMLSSTPESTELLLTIANTYYLAAQEITDVEELPFYDTHSLDAQRMVNFLCYAYGAYPNDYEHLVDEDLFPRERADQCSLEYQQMVTAWDTLLEPHVKP